MSALNVNRLREVLASAAPPSVSLVEIKDGKVITQPAAEAPQALGPAPQAPATPPVTDVRLKPHRFAARKFSAQKGV